MARTPLYFMRDFSAVRALRAHAPLSDARFEIKTRESRVGKMNPGRTPKNLGRGPEWPPSKKHRRLGMGRGPRGTK